MMDVLFYNKNIKNENFKEEIFNIIKKLIKEDITINDDYQSLL